jgi:hypothetical protein
VNDAEYYQQHKDDPDEWGEPVERKPSRRLASMVSVRLAPEELDRIRQAAEDAGESVSNFIRRAALDRSTYGAAWTATAGVAFAEGSDIIASHANGVVSEPITVQGIRRAS